MHACITKINNWYEQILERDDHLVIPLVQPQRKIESRVHYLTLLAGAHFISLGFAYLAVQITLLNYVIRARDDVESDFEHNLLSKFAIIQITHFVFIVVPTIARWLGDPAIIRVCEFIGLYLHMANLIFSLYMATLSSSDEVFLHWQKRLFVICGFATYSYIHVIISFPFSVWRDLQDLWGFLRAMFR